MAPQRQDCPRFYLPWMVGPFFFFSAPSSKCLQRPRFFILKVEHFSHFILRVIFLVTLAFLWKTGFCASHQSTCQGLSNNPWNLPLHHTTASSNLLRAL